MTRRQRGEQGSAIAFGVLLAATVGCTTVPDLAATKPASAPPTSPPMTASGKGASGGSGSASMSAAVEGATPAPHADDGGATKGPAGATPAPQGQAGTMGQDGRAPMAMTMSGFGMACETDSACPSAMCVKGRCCAVRQCGTCERCGADGQCTKIRNEADAYSCDESVGICDANAMCTLKNGSKCSPEVGPSVARCASGHCDTYCCATACGVCQRCKQSGAGCEPVAFADDIGSCAGTTSCHSGECVDVALNTTSRGSQLMLLPNDEVAQTFDLRVPGKLVEIRLDTSCPREALSVRRLPDDPTQELPPDEELVSLLPRSSDEGSSTLSYVISPPLAFESRQRFAFVLKNTTNGRCSMPIGIGDSLSRAKVFIRSSGTMGWTEQTQQSLSYKVLMTREP